MWNMRELDSAGLPAQTAGMFMRFLRWLTGSLQRASEPGEAHDDGGAGNRH